MRLSIWMPPMATKSIHKPEYKVLVKLLRQARKDAGLDQKDLAALLERRQSYVSNVERGRRRLDLLELREHCLACGQELAALVVRFEKEIADQPDRLVP